MARVVEFFFDIVSPASYLAWTQMDKLADETGAQVIYRPFFLPGIFEKAGNASPITVPAKGKWVFRDFKRFARMYDVPFVLNKDFPLSSVYVMRGLNNYAGTEFLRPLGDAFYKCSWVDNENFNDPKTVQRIVESVGIDPKEYQEKLNDPANKQALMTVTEEAVSRGVFGAPSFFVGDKMQFGQDRLDFVKEDLLEQPE